MFNQINRKIFSKLYRYYCRKLLEQWFTILLMFIFSLFMLYSFTFLLKKFDETATWSQYVGRFWMISLLQMFGMVYIMSDLVARLVGYSSSFSSKSYSNYGMRKKSNNEDITVLHFTPGVDRPTLIWAKYAAIATYFFPINLLFYVLPFVFYLIIAAKISFLAILGFLLLNGLVFSVMNFLWLVPLLFYFYEDFSFLMFLALFIFVMVAALGIYFFHNTIFQYPLLLPLLALPLSGIFGYFFFRLYWGKFLKKDLV